MDNNDVAQINFNQAKTLNSDAEGALFRTSKATGQPVEYLRTLDNQNVNPDPVFSTLSPSVSSFFAESVNNAAVAKDSVEELGQMEFLSSGTGWAEVHKRAKEYEPTFQTEVPEIEAQKIEYEHLQKVQATLFALQRHYPEYNNLDDRGFKAIMGQIGELYNTDLSDISFDEVKNVEVGKETDWGRALNVFGIRDMGKSAAKSGEMRTPQNNMRYETMFGRYANSPEMVELQESVKALRGNTWSNAVLEGVLASIPFMAETAASLATGGGAKAATVAAKLKAMQPALFKQVLGNVPGNLAKTDNDLAQRNYFVFDGKGGLEQKSTEEKTRHDYINYNVMLSLQRYIEGFTEMAGGLAPKGVLSKILPKKATELIGKIANSSTGKAVNKITDLTQWNGVLAEYGEEVFGQGLSYLATKFSQLDDDNKILDFADMGQNSVFGSLYEESQTFATVAVMGSAFNAARLGGVAIEYARYGQAAFQYDANLSAIKDKIDSSTIQRRSPDQTEEFLNRVDAQNGEVKIGYLSAEDAGALYQSNQDVMDKLGLNREVIGDAEAQGEFIPVNINALLTKSERSGFDAVKSKLRVSPATALSIENLANSEISEQTYAKMQIEIAETNQATQESERLHKELISSGLKPTHIREGLRVINYLADYANHESNGAITASQFLKSIKVTTEGIVVEEPAKAITLDAEIPSVLPAEELTIDEKEEIFKALQSEAPHAYQATEEIINEKFNELKANFARKLLNGENVVGMGSIRGGIGANKKGQFGFGINKVNSAQMYETREEAVNALMEELMPMIYEKYKDNFALYQSQGGDIRGAITFTGEYDAVIHLMQGSSDVSTIVHEASHHTYHMMEYLVNKGLASEKMVEDFRVLQNYAQESGGDYVEQQERIAVAFEQYVMTAEGKSLPLRRALSALRDMMIRIYKSIKLTNIKLSDEVKSVFDSWINSESKVEEQSLVRQFFDEVDVKSLLTSVFGVNKSNTKSYLKLLHAAKEEAIEKHQAEKTRIRKKMQSVWRKSADDFIANHPEYSIRKDIRERGKLSYAEAEELGSKDVADALLKAKLATKSGKNTVSALEYFENAQHKDVDIMLKSVAEVQDENAFIKSYMDYKDNELSETLGLSEEAIATEATLALLEKAQFELTLLSGTKTSRKFSSQNLKKEVQRTLLATLTKQVVNPNKTINEARKLVSDFAKLATTKDYQNMLNSIDKLRYKMELIKSLGSARKSVEKFVTQTRRSVNAKKNTIDAPYQDAITDLAYRLGVVRTSKPEKIERVKGALEKIIRDTPFAGMFDQTIIKGMVRYGDLNLETVLDVADLVNFLTQEGKERVHEDRVKEWEEIDGAISAYLDHSQNFKKHKRFEDAKWVNLFGTLKHGMTTGRKLRDWVLAGSNYDTEAPLAKVYNDWLVAAEHDCTQLYSKVNHQIDTLMKEIQASSKDVDFKLLDAKAPLYNSNYKNWNQGVLLAFALNQGTENNLKRLMGTGLSSETGLFSAEDIAFVNSQMSSQTWESINKLYEVIGSGDMHQAVKAEFRRDTHTELKDEVATPFTVVTKDGVEFECQGGYYPISYQAGTLNHRSSVEDLLSSNFVGSEYILSSHKERSGEADGILKLDLMVLQKHVNESVRYATTNQSAKRFLKMVADKNFKERFIENNTLAGYNALLKLAKNYVRPEQLSGDFISKFESWGRSINTNIALWGSLSVVSMQTASATLAADELGVHYFDSLKTFMANPAKFTNETCEQSGFMRERYYNKDFEFIKGFNARFETGFTKTKTVLKDAGFAGIRVMDMAVSSIIWQGAYAKASNEGKSDKQAKAYADELVRRTQGSSSPLDMSEAQLSALGRAFLPFFSASSATGLNAWNTINKVARGNYANHGEATMALLANAVLPVVVIAPLIRVVFSGALRDDDKITEVFLKEMISGFAQHIPLVRNAVDGAIDLARSKGAYSSAMTTAGSSGWARGSLGVGKALKHAGQGDIREFCYYASQGVSDLAGVPVVTAYERLVRHLRGLGVDIPSAKPVKKQTIKREVNYGNIREF